MVSKDCLKTDVNNSHFVALYSTSKYDELYVFLRYSSHYCWDHHGCYQNESLCNRHFVSLKIVYYYTLDSVNLCIPNATIIPNIIKIVFFITLPIFYLQLLVIYRKWLYLGIHRTYTCYHCCKHHTIECFY